MKLPYLNKINDTIYFQGNLLEIYIPKSNFDGSTPISKLEGEYLDTLGIFNFVYYPNEKDMKTKEFHTLKLSFRIKISFTDTVSVKTKMPGDDKEEPYVVFKLKSGDIFCLNTKQEKSANNTKDEIFLIHGGHLPKSIKYDDILGIYADSALLNGVNLNSQFVMFEYVISELCRYSKDQSIPFRKKVGDKGVSQYDYTAINLKRLPSLNSTFNALTFEDIVQSIITSIDRTKSGGKEVESPVEKVIKL